MVLWVGRAGIVALTLAGWAASAQAASYEFLAVPAINLNRVFRIDKSTGEIGACQYAFVENQVGTTLCYPPGEGGGAQAQSEYALIATHHEKEGGVFRVDLRSGTMSICYVLNDRVVCTPPAK